MAQWWDRKCLHKTDNVPKPQASQPSKNTYFQFFLLSSTWEIMRLKQVEKTDEDTKKNEEGSPQVGQGVSAYEYP